MAQTIGILFGEPDPWVVLNDWPPRVFNVLRARYLLEPWDAANLNALVEAKYKPPTWLTQKGRFMTKEELAATFREARG